MQGGESDGSRPYTQAGSKGILSVQVVLREALARLLLGAKRLLQQSKI